MITLGDTDYTPRQSRCSSTRSRTSGTATRSAPTDWRDVWMNEGMTMYLQAVCTRPSRAASRSTTEMDEYAAAEQRSCASEAGPPGDYDPATFGEGNIYYGPR